MIWRITGYFFLFDLFVAILLALNGITEVGIDNNFMMLLRQASETIKPYTFNIPKIPQIPKFTNPYWIYLVLNFLISVVNGLTGLINFIIVVLNLIINLFNYVVVLLAAFFVWLNQLGVGDFFARLT